MKKNLLLFISLFALTLTLSAQIVPCGSVCKNPSFENDTTDWNYATGDHCQTAGGPICNQTPGRSPAHHKIQTIGNFDAFAGGTLLPVVPAGGQNKSLRLGDSIGVGLKVAIATYTFDVTPNQKYFIYNYALVMQQEAGHTDTTKTFFRVKSYDLNQTQITSKTIRTNTPNITFNTSSVNPIVIYTNWKKDSIDFSSYIGQCVTVEFAAADCALGGHWMYAYIDAVCDSSITTGISEEGKYALSVFPNPNNGSFKVSTNYLDGFSLEIFNSLGALVYKEKSESKEYIIKNSSLKSGVYFVKIVNNSGDSKIQKIVIE